MLATQNPIELEGTYPLPEAQLDRFLFKINVGRNPAEVLTRIVLNREMGMEPAVPRVLDAEELLRLMELARRIAIPDAVAGYIGRLVNATHPGEIGSGPRCQIRGQPPRRPGPGRRRQGTRPAPGTPLSAPLKTCRPSSVPCWNTASCWTTWRSWKERLPETSWNGS